MTFRLRNVSFVLILIAIVGYTIPWLINRSTGLTMGAYDLAEWASLHPQVRFESELLLTPLLLRLPLALMALMIVFVASKEYLREIRLICFAVLALYLLPPLEFLTVSRNDVNYVQGFILVVIMSIAGFIGFFVPIRQRWRAYIMLGLIGFTLISAIWGVLEIRDLMNGFGLDPQLGMGIFLIVPSLAGLLAVVLGTKNRVAEQLP